MVPKPEREEEAWRTLLTIRRWMDTHLFSLPLVAGAAPPASDSASLPHRAAVYCINFCLIVGAGRCSDHSELSAARVGQEGRPQGGMAGERLKTNRPPEARIVGLVAGFGSSRAGIGARWDLFPPPVVSSTVACTTAWRRVRVSALSDGDASHGVGLRALTRRENESEPDRMKGYTTVVSSCCCCCLCCLKACPLPSTLSISRRYSPELVRCPSACALL